MINPRTNFAAFCELLGYPKPTKQQIEFAEGLRTGQKLLFMPRNSGRKTFNEAVAKYLAQQPNRKEPLHA